MALTTKFYNTPATNLIEISSSYASSAISATASSISGSNPNINVTLLASSYNSSYVSILSSSILYTVPSGRTAKIYVNPEIHSMSVSHKLTLSESYSFSISIRAASTTLSSKIYNYTVIRSMAGNFYNNINVSMLFNQGAAADIFNYTISGSATLSSETTTGTFSFDNILSSFSGSGGISLSGINYLSLNKFSTNSVTTSDYVFLGPGQTVNIIISGTTSVDYSILNRLSVSATSSGAGSINALIGILSTPVVVEYKHLYNPTFSFVVIEESGI